MIRQPVLEGDTLHLRPMADSDREALFALASDRELWALHPMHDRWQRPVFDLMIDDALASGGALVVIERATGRIIGSSQYRASPLDPEAIEIGWTFLARDRWGGAVNREMKRLMLAHALQAVPRCLFRVGAENWRSRRAMEKIGGVLTDLREEIRLPDGREVTHLVYAIDRAGFAAGPLA